MENVDRIMSYYWLWDNGVKSARSYFDADVSSQKLSSLGESNNAEKQKLTMKRYNTPPEAYQDLLQV